MTRHRASISSFLVPCPWHWRTKRAGRCWWFRLASMSDQVEGVPMNLLLAITDDDLAPATIAVAEALHKRRNAKPSAVYVIEIGPSVPEAGIIVAQFEEELRNPQALAKQVDEMRPVLHLDSGAKATWPFEIVAGAVGREIVEAARKKGSDLIVMGLNRHAAMSRAIGNDTAREVMAIAGVPVLAVRPQLAGLPASVVIAVDFSRASIRAARLACHDQLLIGRNDPQLHARSIGVKTALGAVGQLRVAFGIHLDTEPVHASADAFADGRCVLADTAREDDGVNAIECRDVRADVLARAIAEHIDCEPRTAVAVNVLLLQEIPHVGCESGEAEQTGLFVEHRLDVVAAQPFLGSDEVEDRRIEIAGTRSHNEAFERREAHRCVDRATGRDCARGCSIAQMKCDDAGLLRSPAGQLAIPISDIPVRRTVKAVSPDFVSPVQLVGDLSLIHISEPTRQAEISYAVFC